MSISAIEGIGGALGASGIFPQTGVQKASGLDDDWATTPAQGVGSEFATALSNGIESLQAAQSKSDQLAVQAATGDLQDLHDYTIAATEASLATSLTVAVRDKAVAAFQEIMRLQA
ncbi:flagellar hook-basal body complex protein FliE [Motilibacter aurantiacus]|uniref:flagellar hook-basal body complex protein FliE n=1 Tax=Motilibacter aurantiacus TaxID=2714955 RepID=UPI00140AB878|nr:flagellar hook-basal body complex protein FliE [Motilibacter aurantiacus]NHC47093.1 flagellar hook-basal body complex protein FliE [Motilibacter aurantiacus]